MLGSLGGEQRGRRVRARLRLLHEQEPVEQLDRVVLVEESVIDQPRIFAARPAMQGRPLRLLHARMLSAPYGGVNVPDGGYPDAGRATMAARPPAKSRDLHPIYQEEGFHGTLPA